MKKTVKILFVLLFSICTCIFGTVVYFSQTLSDTYCIMSGENLVFSNNPFISCEHDQAISVQKTGVETIGNYTSNVKLFGVVPIKNVQITIADESDVLVLGTPFGIRIRTEGVLIVGFCDVDTKDGDRNPAAESGLKVGDSIIKINGQIVSSNQEVQKIVSSCGGEKINLDIKRGNESFSVTVTPVMSKSEKRFKTGLWIRDSSAGIGTLTFYSPALKVTAGLGHGICDADTGELLPLLEGEFIEADIVGIKKSGESVTGELQGVFSGAVFSEFSANEITGVYGCNCDNLSGGTVYPVAMKQEIVAGNATIITTLDSEGPKSYECIIEKIYHNDSSKIKNMIIKITDKELIEKTGGIVQGMSGSPIIQNGKLIGAVTHVFVNDSCKGYGIFAENMLETAQSVAESNKLKDVS